jgi:hypothetical protein
LSFVPWAIAVLSHAPGSHGPNTLAAHWSSDQIPPLVRAALTLPTPVHFRDLYLEPVAVSLRNGLWSDDFQITELCISLAVAFGVASFWLALASVIAAWRKAIRNPVLAAALIAIVVNGPIIFAARIGNFMHYWLSVVPLAFYVMAWSVTGAPLRQWAKLQRVLAFGFCATSALAGFSFLLLVHVNRGLPGEYGPAYRTSATAQNSSR